MNSKNILSLFTDTIYYIIVGTFNILEEIKTSLINNTISQNNEFIEYFILKTIVPIEKHKKMLEKIKNISIELDASVCEAQANAYCEYSQINSYMLVILQKLNDQYVLTYPKFFTHESHNPEKKILKEMSKITNSKIMPLISSTIKPCSLIGKNRDIILYISVIINN